MTDSWAPRVFSEAARLYAENVDLIAEMRKVHDGEVDEFLDELHSRVEAQAKGSVGEKRTAGFRYWWLQATPDDGEAPVTLWFSSRDPVIALRGTLSGLHWRREPD